MTISPERPLLPVVPLTGDVEGCSPTAPCASGRAAMTCLYRCGDACSHDAPNTSSNETFADVMAQVASRRGVLRAGAVIGAATAATAAFAGPVAAAPVSLPSAQRGPASTTAKKGPFGLRFRPVAPNTADALTVPEGYTQDVVIRWGDPLFKDSPRWSPTTQSGAAQRRQFGFNNDFLALLPLARGTQLLVANHEYTTEEMMYPGYDPANPTKEQVETSWAAHGLSVVTVQETRSGSLKPVVGHRLNRRFHTQSRFVLTGPVAGHALVRTKADPKGRTVLGTLNNCSGGTTPWGTWLTAEENFNQYFANAAQVSDPTTAQRLGRFKHEAAQPRITKDGRVAVYMGDDERFDYLYKFVSRDKVKKGTSRAAKRHNDTLLDHGTLYVARLTGDSPSAQIDGSGTLPKDGEFDGSGAWIPLVSGDRSFVQGFTAEEVLLFTRLAADQVGATKMDRPEDVEPSPVSGKVYVALTNNSNRGASGKAGPDEANPRKANKNGHVLELTERRNDSASTRFEWNLLLVCGDPNDASTYFGGYDKSQVSPISCPDNVAFDRHGNLWISTDGNALGSNDGLFGVAVEGRDRGLTRQFLTVPFGAETCGPVVQRKRVLVCVQHPGEKDGATADAPASHWPDGGTSLPRPAIALVRRKDGGDIGA